MSERTSGIDSVDFSEPEGLSESDETLSVAEESIEVPLEVASLRVDVYLSQHLGLSRAFIQKIIKSGNLKSRDRVISKPSRLLNGGELLNIRIPPPRNIDIVPEPVDFSVVYEDSQILIIDKPAGVVVHPAPGNWRGTLVHGLLHRFPDIGTINDAIRPGIVHRLDSTTSGLMVVARTAQALHSLQESFRNRCTVKIYLALAVGRRIEEKISVREPIERDRKNRYRMAVSPTGKDAWTDVVPIWNAGPYTFVMCRLHTGRTHQIRVHLRYLGAPLAGDELYGFKKKIVHPAGSINSGRVFLHAWKLSIPHPKTGLPMEFRSFLPPDLVSILKGVLSTYGG